MSGYSTTVFDGRIIVNGTNVSFTRDNVTYTGFCSHCDCLTNIVPNNEPCIYNSAMPISIDIQKNSAHLMFRVCETRKRPRYTSIILNADTVPEFEEFADRAYNFDYFDRLMDAKDETTNTSTNTLIDTPCVSSTNTSPKKARKKNAPLLMATPKIEISAAPQTQTTTPMPIFDYASLLNRNAQLSAIVVQQQSIINQLTFNNSSLQYALQVAAICQKK